MAICFQELSVNSPPPMECGANLALGTKSPLHTPSSLGSQTWRMCAVFCQDMILISTASVEGSNQRHRFFGPSSQNLRFFPYDLRLFILSNNGLFCVCRGRVGDGGGGGGWGLGIGE